jgi:pimeloyl-ACP methyl ester carboxylesterase
VKARTPEGVELYYECAGDGDAVLLIHGTTATHGVWQLQVPAYSPHFKVITPDLRGAGFSDVPEDPGDYSVGRFAADLAVILDDAGIDRAHVMGISLGGGVALRFALDFPERVRSLQLVSAWGRTDEFLRRIFFEPLGRSLDRGDQRESFRYGLGLIMSPEYLETREPAEVADVVTDVFVKNPVTAPGFRGHLAAGLAHDERARLGEVRVPTAVIVGELDANVPPRYSKELAREIEPAELTILRGPRASHCAPIEMAAEFNALTLEFMQQVH